MKKKIPMVDLYAQYRLIKQEVDNAIKNVIKQSNYIGGSNIMELEKKLAEYCGVKYAVAVNSGTDALFLSLKALGIGKGDEVITTPYTFIATAEAIALNGAKVVFADINDKAFNINPSEIIKKITKRTK